MSITRSVRARRLGVAATALTIALTGACANDGAKQPKTPDIGNVQLVAALEPFDKCDDFLSYVKREAQKQVTAYGLGGGVIAYDDMMPVPMAGAAERSSAPLTTMAGDQFASDSAAGKATEADASTSSANAATNNQEANVDEADLVKADGNRIATVRGNQLVLVDLIDGAPHITTTLNLGDNFYGDRLFLLADRAYVLGSDQTADGMGGGAVIEVSLVGTPAVAHRMTIEGNILDGRMVNGTLRLVLSTPGGSGLGFVYPSGGGGNSEDLAKETNQKVIESSTLDDWLPDASIDGGKSAPLLDCDHLYRPAELSGFSMLSILTISNGLGSMTGSGVLADGQTTYASTDHLYVATTTWASMLPDGAVAKRSTASSDEYTDVHAFSIAGTEPAAYEASGRVDGHLLNQYSMSESKGNLRIATTTNAQWGNVGGPMPECPPNADCAITTEPTQTSEGDSQVVVLSRDGGSLKEIGKVDGLGVGEQIKSVRYVGDTAYVVTFRQTDPFYVLDLSDPTAPKKLGELKVPGFSSYLHPVGDRLVLGVGSAAGDTGRVTGAKLSLYDTSDPVNPKEVTTWTEGSMQFNVDYDSHAFHWDAERKTAYLPYTDNGCIGTRMDCDVSAYPQNGVLVVKVADGAITVVGRIDHNDRTPSPEPTTPTTTVPDTTTTTATPETTVPETTVPDTTTTAPVETTVPTTVVASSSGDSGTSSSPSAAIGQIEPMPLPTDPGIGCDPAACDPGMPVNYVPSITRVFVIGDRVITLSDVGIAAHDVTTLKLTGFASF